MFRMLFLALLATAAFAQGLGKWKLNPEKSTFDPGPVPASETYIFEAAPGGQIATRFWLGRDGRQVTNRIVLLFDGKWHPLSGERQADEICTREISDRLVVSQFKRKGEVVMTDTRVVSPDGKVTTITFEGTKLDGKFRNVKVLELVETRQ